MSDAYGILLEARWLSDHARRGVNQEAHKKCLEGQDETFLKRTSPRTISENAPDTVRVAHPKWRSRDSQFLLDVFLEPYRSYSGSEKAARTTPNIYHMYFKIDRQPHDYSFKKRADW